MTTTKPRHPTWSEIALEFDQRLADDIRASLPSKIGRQPISGMSAGIRSFLAWLTEQNDQLGQDAKAVMLGTSQLPEIQRTDRMVHALKRWRTFLEQYYKANTVGHYVSRCLIALGALTELDPGRYTVVPKRLISVSGTGKGHTPSLGQARWPELDGLVGIPRERRALAIIKEEALATFNLEEEMLMQGHSLLLSNEAFDQPEEQCHFVIREYLRHAALSSDDGYIYSRSVSDPNTWIAAGFPISPDKRNTRFRAGHLRSLVLSCLAPSPNMNTALLRILCCEVGWNLQPMLDIARSPFLLVTQSSTGIINAAFLQSWKNRASHSVLAYLEDRSLVPPPLLADNVRAELSTLLDEQRNGTDEIYRELNTEAVALDVMQRYVVLAERSRRLFPTPDNIDTLLIQWAHGIRRFLSPHNSRILPKRPGATISSIRKTYLMLKKREVPTLGALRSIAGHTGTNVLMPHYLNQDEGVSAFRESIRFAQNSIQAVVLRNRRETAIALGITATDLEWFMRCAKLSGIRSALLPEEVPEPTPTGPHFLFPPSPENFKGLYLIHFSLICARFRMRNRRRWVVQGQPLLTFVMGMIRSLSLNGLKLAYKAASKECLADLRTGRVELPAVLRV